MTIRYRSKETLSEIIISEKSFFVIPQRSVFIMAKIELLDSYEDLLNYVEEIRESMDLIHNWLAKEPDWDSQCDLYEFIAQHSSQFAVLNLIMYRLDSLKDEHRTIIDNYIKGV